MAEGDSTPNPGTVLLSHLPHGFYKEEMKGFFSQFGTVLKIAHPLSKRTNRPKGFAFIQFQHEEVAHIVADTMNGYLLYGKILRCKYIPTDKLPKKVFKNAKRPYLQHNFRRREEEKRNQVRTPEQHQKLVKSLLAKENKKRKKLQELGIDYDFPGYAAEVPTKESEESNPNESE